MRSSNVNFLTFVFNTSLLCWLFWVFHLCVWISEIICWYPCNNSLWDFLLRSHLILQLTWGRTDIVAILSLWIWDISPFIVSFDFFHQNLYIFHTNLANNLLGLYLRISLFGANVIYSVFHISHFHCWYFLKRLTFVTL